MELMMVAGVVAFVFGVLFLCAPRVLQRWNEAFNRRVSGLDPTLMQHRIGAGLCLVAVGVFCLVSAYYVWLRLHS